MAALIEACRTGALHGIAEVVLVISNRPDAGGLQVAREQGVSAVVIPSRGRTREAFEQEAVAAIREVGADFIVLAGFMRRLTPLFTDAFPGRIVNIHPADTRFHRGLGAYEWAWENRLPVTKITVHFVNDKIDDGRVVAQADVDLRGARSLEEVKRRGLAVEHRFYAEALKMAFDLVG